MFDQIFSDLATGFSDQFGAPYTDATANWPGTPTKDAGGSITDPGTPVSKACKAQVSRPTQAMREDAGFLQTDMRLHVLVASLDATLDTEAQIVIASGVHAGTWELQSVDLDSAGIGWTCRGRKIS